MLTRVIEDFTHTPGAPKGWKPEDGTCGTLPIRVSMRADGKIAYCESAWEPTPDELAMLNGGGKLVLRVMGWQIPVAMWCEPAEPDDTMADLLAAA